MRKPEPLSEEDRQKAMTAMHAAYSALFMDATARLDTGRFRQLRDLAQAMHAGASCAVIGHDPGRDKHATEQQADAEGQKLSDTILDQLTYADNGVARIRNERNKRHRG